MSGVADTETPRVVSVSKGQLEYQTGGSNQWLPLQSYKNDREPLSTIHSISFRDKNISFVQQTCGGAISCGVRLRPMHYGSSIKVGTVEGGESLPLDITVELTREETCLPTCGRSANAGTRPQHTIHQCPLAGVCQSFTAMRLYLPRDNFVPPLKGMSGPNEFWYMIVNALRRDVVSVPQPILDNAPVEERFGKLHSSQQKSLAPIVPKVDITPVEQRFNNLLSNPEQSAPPGKLSVSDQKVANSSESHRIRRQTTSTQQSKVQSSPLPVNHVLKPPTTPQQQPVPPMPNQATEFVQPVSPKPKQISEFARSQSALLAKTINTKLAVEPQAVNTHSRKILDLQDRHPVGAVPSESIDLDYGNATTPSQKGSAKKAQRPKWEASIIQLRTVEEVADLEGDKAMADKARKMIKIFEGDAASPGKETKAQVENFKRLWTLL